jgi:hypothetical protein
VRTLKLGVDICPQPELDVTVHIVGILDPERHLAVGPEDNRTIGVEKSWESDEDFITVELTTLAAPGRKSYHPAHASKE